MDKYVHGHIGGLCLFCPGRRHVTGRAGHALTVVTDETVGRVGATLTDVMGATTGERTDIDAGALLPVLLEISVSL